MPAKTGSNKRTTVSKTASAGTTAGAKSKVASSRSVTVKNGDNLQYRDKLSSKEIEARKIQKYATTTFGFNSRNAYSAYGGGNTAASTQGNFYSPQLSTDFLEKPQNLRERRAWYRHFYNSNEYVGQAVDLHSTLPLSKIRLEKPRCENDDYANYVYDFYVEMCDEIKLFKVLSEISHEYWLLGNVFCFSEDHEPYRVHDTEDETEATKINEIKEYGRTESKRLYNEFKIIDKDPNYKGWKKIVILPPDQVKVKKIPLSDDVIVEFVPDPETRKSILHKTSTSQLSYGQYEVSEELLPNIPYKLISQLQDNGSIPLDTDPYSGSHVAHIARKKSQYETLGVSILERCVNTLLLFDKLRQAQTSIASRHMTPIRIVWAEELSEYDVESLREQVDLALVDPDYSIITNYQVNWEEMGSNGRLLELGTEYDHIENSLFAGLGVTRELLTGEGTYSGSRITLEVLNTQYLLFREILQDYVENNLFKPIAKKKGFIEKDKFGRDKLVYPKLSFTRLAIRDNDQFFDQAMQLYNKGSLSIDVILEMLNVDPVATRKKIEADLFSVNDFAFNQFMLNMYSTAATSMVESYDINERIALYLGLNPLAPPTEGGGEDSLGAGGGGAGGLRFASKAKAVTQRRKEALDKILDLVQKKPEKLDKILEYLRR